MNSEQGIAIEEKLPQAGQEASPMDKYRTRERANNPNRVFLFDPATGKKTEDWMDVVSSLSDRFRIAKDTAYQIAGDHAAIKDPKVRAERVYDSQVRMKASLVVAWSFPGPCNEDTVTALLKDAPQLQMLVVSAADDTQSFFSEPSSD